MILSVGLILDRVWLQKWVMVVVVGGCVVVLVVVCVGFGFGCVSNGVVVEQLWLFLVLAVEWWWNGYGGFGYVVASGVVVEVVVAS